VTNHYTGATLDSTVTRDTQTGTARPRQTWKIHLPVPILFESFVADVRIAGTYDLKIDGVTVATHACAAASLNNTWTPAAPIELAAGTHTFVLDCGTTVQWYNCSNSTQAKTGTGAHVIGWDVWEEPGTSASVAGKINFKIPDGVLVSKVESSSTSTVSQSAQTWSVTFANAVKLLGVLKRLVTNEATGYDFKVDGTTVATVVKAHAFDVGWEFVPGSPVSIAAGARTLKFQASANRAWRYQNVGTTVPDGSGSAETTAWGLWQEATPALDDTVPAALFFAFLPGVPTAVDAEALSSSAIELSWSAPSGGHAVYYEVRIDGGAAVEATSPHTFTGLTPGTSYDLEVRAVSPAGASAWVLVTESTLDTAVTEGYNVVLRIGGHSWDIDAGDPADPDAANPLAGVLFSWSAPDDIGWPPRPYQMDPDTLTVRVTSPQAAFFEDVRRYDVVRFAFTPAGFDTTAPLVDFAGIVTNNPKVTRDPAGGAVLEVTAVDYRAVLQLVTIFGVDEDDGGEFNGETGPGIWHVSVPDYDGRALIQGGIMVDHPDLGVVGWGGVGEWINEALTNDYGDPWMSIPLPLDIFNGEDVSEELGPFRSPLVTYETPDDVVTLHDVYKALGVYPWPVFDPATGNLEGFRYWFVHPNGEGDYTVSELDAGIVLGEVEWRRGVCTDVVEVKTTSGQPFIRHISGEDYAAFYSYADDIPPEVVKRISYKDRDYGGFNIDGFVKEVTTGWWSPYKMTVLADQDPTTVAGWFNYPERVSVVVHVTDIEEERHPLEFEGFRWFLERGEFYGRLSRASLLITAGGAWSVEARLRPRLPKPILDDLEP
jgi:hypothetical protein